MKKILTIATLLTTSVFAQTEVPPCKGAMMADECKSYQDYWRKRIEQEAENKRIRAEHKREYEERQASEEAARQRRQSEIKAENDAREAKRKQEQMERDKQDAEEDRLAAVANKRAAAAESVRKSQCGQDYKSPSIGMTLDRLKQCVTAVRLTSQLNRNDGIVSTYQGGGAYFHVMDGRIVSWGR